jgi:release factor glutamine methyltransferase
MLFSWEPDQKAVSYVRDAMSEITELVQPPSRLQGTIQRQGREWLRKAIHLFSYHLILKRRTTRRTRAAGFNLTVGPTVFHPRYFITSEFFAGFIDCLDVTGKHVADVGTGSGILALAAARAGASHVTAIDINPNAVASAALNARANGYSDRFTSICSNLLSAVAVGETFDVIISSPPSFEGEPIDIADRAWHAGPSYRDISDLFDQARLRLKPGGRLYLLVSSHSDLDLLRARIKTAGFQAREVARRWILIESLIIYELVLVSERAELSSEHASPVGVDVAAS